MKSSNIRADRADRPFDPSAEPHALRQHWLRHAFEEGRRETLAVIEARERRALSSAGHPAPIPGASRSELDRAAEQLRVAAQRLLQLAAVVDKLAVRLDEERQRRWCP